jgi:phosphoribosyl 1,2-cyclic phosphodiesterase
MKFIILASGSKGNSTLIISDKEELLLIDAGISYKEIKEKINRYGYDSNNINHVLITHEHDDHIKCINSFSNAKIYSLKDINVANNYLDKYKETFINGFNVMALPLSHDVKCCGYVIKNNNETLVYITDTGYINYKNIQYITNADYYIFESNHNVPMLMETKRPFFIKSRILGDEGHLSNEVASDTLCDIIGNKTKQIYLAHISQEANTKEKAINTLYNKAKERDIELKNIFINAADQNIELTGGAYHEKSSISI